MYNHTSHNQRSVEWVPLNRNTFFLQNTPLHTQLSDVFITSINGSGGDHFCLSFCSLDHNLTLKEMSTIRSFPLHFATEKNKTDGTFLPKKKEASDSYLLLNAAL